MMMMLMSMSSTSVPDFLCYFLGWLISHVIFWCIIEPRKVKNLCTYVTVFFSNLVATCKKLLDQVQHLEFRMATQQMSNDFASSSESSSSMVSSEKYDVFLSFRGEDTRKNFTSHLYIALRRKNLKTFKDDNELKKGDEISPALIKAIEESCVSIVIFSKDYASSRWCLNELIKILECKKDREQIVIPVFYDIDASHVRKQIGSYQEAFAKHERDLKRNKDKLPKWKAALSEAANLVGWDSQNYRIEPDLIKDIVEDVMQKLKYRYPHAYEDKGLVRIEESLEQIESLLNIGSNDISLLGIWGMGGIGKTTLAKCLYDKLSSQFEGHFFVIVREESNKNALNIVRDKLFSRLLGDENICLDRETSFVRRRLARQKVFIVLDNVDTSEQVEDLILKYNCLGPGSRVIVTSRDQQVFRQLLKCSIYEVKKLDFDDSLQLFCLTVFGEKRLKIGYEDLSKRVIVYCNGNPLALKVLGANLRSRSVEFWESELDKLQKIPNVKIHDVLKLSYDGLDRFQKDIFLDIACLMEIVWDKSAGCVTSVLDACGFHAVSGIEVLKDKALIQQKEYFGICFFGFSSTYVMHNLIQETGREIVSQESKDPGKRSRLWRTEEVCDVLKKNKGTEVVEGINLNLCELVEDLCLGPDSFKRMINLRFLKIHIHSNKATKKVYFPDGLGWLSGELRYLHWYAFGLESLPPNFCAEMLVELRMPDSRLKKLWDGIQDLKNLKEIYLRGSEDLIEVPNLSKAPNLEIVDLSGCVSLRQLHPSILSLPKLTHLYLQDCKMMESLKTNIHSKSLRELSLNGCSSLTEFSVTSEEMTHLILSGTAIRELPSSIWRNNKLTHLGLDDCNHLNTVGNKLSNDPGLGSLTRLWLNRCTQINASNLWCILDGIRSLTKLALVSCCNLEAIPINIRNHSMLKGLCIRDCEKLVSLPSDLPPSLQCLELTNCSSTSLDTQGPLLENILQSMSYIKPPPLIMPKNGLRFSSYFFCLPGGQVPGMFEFHATEASITIPPIPKSNLCGFIFCFILSGGTSLYDIFLHCYIYEHGKKVDDYCLGYPYNFAQPPLISDHVLLWWCGYDIQESGGNHNNSPSFSFEVKYELHKGYWFMEDTEEAKKWPMGKDAIKGCGILPVYASELGFELYGGSCSREKIGQLESNAQISYQSDQHLEMDIDDSQPKANGDEIRVSNYENEDGHHQEQLVIPANKRRRI